jgi:hypothetical protein
VVVSFLLNVSSQFSQQVVRAFGFLIDIYMLLLQTVAGQDEFPATRTNHKNVVHTHEARTAYHKVSAFRIAFFLIFKEFVNTDKTNVLCHVIV